jgi:ribosomal-protein-alanine N-acetyltransferase
MNPVSADDLTVRPATEGDVRELSTWRNDPPYDVYDVGDESMEANIEYLLGPDTRCHAIVDGSGDLIGFCTFGPDARVPGGDYSVEALDIGLGIRPRGTGRGHGSRFVATVLEFAATTFRPDTMRVTISEWNTRALRVWEGAGFQRIQRFETPKDFVAMGGGAFIVLVSSTEP